LEASQVAAEEQLRQRVVNEDLDGVKRTDIQVCLLEETRKLATDPIANRISIKSLTGWLPGAALSFIA
jgi:hypothetical protein